MTYSVLKVPLNPNQPTSPTVVNNKNSVRKRKALISSLERQKRLNLDELKLQAQELDNQIAELKASK